MELWKWRTNVRVTVRGKNSVIVHEMHNVITRGALTLARDALRGVGDMKILVVSIGGNGDPPSDEDTALNDERLRVPVILRQIVGIDGLLTTGYVAPNEANDFVINEIGWYSGDATVEEADSGVLMSRVLFNHDKNDLESLQIDRLDTFSEAT